VHEIGDSVIKRSEKVRQMLKDLENSREGDQAGWLSLEEFSYMYMFLDFKGEK
tara:strand:- start:1603 stop:1761 length:159 start_codon:yes stop_codon:yes gene_type:complete